VVVSGETENTQERDQVESQGTVTRTLKTMAGSLNLVQQGRKSVPGMQRDET